MKRHQPSGSLTLMNDSHPGEPPAFGDIISFEVQTDVAQPYVQLLAYQDGILVGEAWEGYWPGALGDRKFVLSSAHWTSGAAECTATLYENIQHGKSSPLASIHFPVSA